MPAKTNPGTESENDADSSPYKTTSLNLEKRVLRKLKARRKELGTQFRSTSALANHLLAKALGLDL